jgi:CheY-like chemotaxis protein
VPERFHLIRLEEGFMSQISVLVVDDDPALRRMLHQTLLNMGAVVWLAGGGSEAVALYREHVAEIDLVLCDMQMPDLDGSQTLQALQQINPAIVCYFMSGDPGVTSVEDLEKRGAGFLYKPFAIREFPGILQKFGTGTRDQPSPLPVS